MVKSGLGLVLDFDKVVEALNVVVVGMVVVVDWW